VAEQVTEIDGRFTWGPPKTEAGRRTVTLPAVAAAALAEHLATYGRPGPEGLVFTSAEGGLLRRSNFNRRVWRPATQAVGVEGLRFHDLRHTSATLSVAAGASTREVMARLGILPRRRAALPARDGRPGRRQRGRPGRADRGRIGARGVPAVSAEWHAGGTNRAIRQGREAPLRR
jgi:Phage integrase family